jgi:hypothetical protein
MARSQQRVTGHAGEADEDRPAAVDAAAPEGRRPPRPALVWTRSGASYSAIIDGREYRVTKYPADSPLHAPYGAYAEGRFIGSGSTLDSVKGRCTAHAGRLRMRSPSRLET